MWYNYLMKTEDFEYEEVKMALEGSSSVKEFLINLGLKVNNGNYRKAEAIAKYNGLKLVKHDSTTNGQLLSKANKIPDDEFFVDGILRNGNSIKKRLLSKGIPDICAECGQEPFWNGKPLVLTVDHIDGNKFNNLIDNLRILCWHCHSQTDTYSNNRGRKVYNYCPCGVRIVKTRKYCDKCRPNKLDNLDKGRKVSIDYPEIDDIIRVVQDSGGWSSCERILGIGQNSLRKHLRRNGIEPKDIQYIRRLNGDE